MSNLKSSNSNFIKILRVGENRKSNGKNERLLQEDQKKTSHSIVTSKGNATASTSVNQSSHHASKISSHRQTIASVQRIKTKSISSNSSTKLGQSSVEKSETKKSSVSSQSDKASNVKEASISSKDIAKTNAASTNKQSVSFQSNKPKKHSTSSRRVSSPGSSRSTTKANATSDASLRSGDGISSQSPSRSSVHAKSSQKQSHAPTEHTVASKQKVHAKSPLSSQRKSTSHFDSSSVKAAGEHLKGRQKQQITPSLSHQSSKRSTKRNFGSKPKIQSHQGAASVGKKKPVAKSSPPTAIVSPVQDRKIAVEKAPQSSATLEEQPLDLHKQQDIYSSSSNNLLDAVNDDKSSLASYDAKIKKPILDTAKAQVVRRNMKLGHDFQIHELKEWMNWCDACGRVMLTLFGKCVSCTKCHMICHVKCSLSVSLTCEGDQHVRSLTLANPVQTSAEAITQETTEESAPTKEWNTIGRVFTLEEVQEKIEEFNGTVKGSQQMTLQDDGKTFRGFVRVTMNLSRPVSVIDSLSKTMHISSTPQPKASFYIDKGATKALHLTSDSTSQDVVASLLIKFRITDNPMKFSLFERQAREEGHVILRKMHLKERPLFLRLLWGNRESNKRSFMLQENESQGVDWESFSVAELHMFIKILDKEENDYIDDIKRKYDYRSQNLIKAIDYQSKLALNA